MAKLLNMADLLQNGPLLLDWLSEQEIDSMIVAGDGLARNSIQSLQIRLLTPKGMPVAVKGLEGAVILLEGSDSRARSIAVITERVEDILFILQNTARIEQVYLYGKDDLDRADLKLLKDKCPECIFI